MSRIVSFRDEIVEAVEKQTSFEFCKFAQAAVREKMTTMKIKIEEDKKIEEKIRSDMNDLGESLKGQE